MFVCEVLDERASPASVVLSGTVVTVTGDSKRDVCIVEDSAGGVTVSTNSSPVKRGRIFRKEAEDAPFVRQTFSEAETIIFLGKRGDDVFINLSSVTCLARGNGGDDLLIGSGGDMLDGGKGNDMVYALASVTENEGDFLFEDEEGDF